MGTVFDLGKVSGGFIILGYFDTLEDLGLAITSPEIGDAYGVGLAPPYTIFVWDGVTSAWLDNGAMKGDKGDKGDQGDTGAEGIAATIGIGTVVTGEAGSSAAVTNCGSDSAAVLDFVIPKGDTGKGLTILGIYASADALQSAVAAPAPGDAYNVGSAAPYHVYIWDGVNLAWVDNGILQGVDGADGASATILVGTVTTGAAGSAAVVTNSGSSAAAVFDFIIPQGVKGDPGIKGDQGDIGATGEAGPNEVSEATVSSLGNGLVKTAEGVLAAAVAGTDYLATETDPTVPAWAKAASKPAYTAAEVGAAAASHSHYYLPIGGGSMQGCITAYNNTDYVMPQVRNIALATSASTPANGAILGVYS